jgi:hypothetical protein
MKHTHAFPETPVHSRSRRVAGMRQGLFRNLLTINRQSRIAGGTSFWIRSSVSLILGIGWIVAMVSLALGSHRGGEEHHVATETVPPTRVGHAIPGAPFQVFLYGGTGTDDEGSRNGVQANAALQTIVEAFRHLMEHRTDYPRFHEALTKEALHQVIIEPKVVNREGKEFLLLVVRTERPGRVNLLMSASALEEQGYLNRPEQLVPVLAREFQWVVSKADTMPKRQPTGKRVDLKQVPIKTNQEIGELSGEEREYVLQDLFRTYLTTIDRHASLKGQSYYETGTTTLVPPAHPDSTIKLYDIRVREALQKIVREPYFQEHASKAIRSLLNGKIWNVAFAHIPDRDWATRTRVVPKDQSITAGQDDRAIQPAMILINIYRTAGPEDPFYGETKELPMGALSVDQLARVIASEIQHHITEKSMRGHVAQDELTAPQSLKQR